MNTNLKIAIVLSGKTERELSFDTRIAETRISDLVGGRGWPSSTERAALAVALGGDHFAGLVGAAIETRERDDLLFDPRLRGDEEGTPPCRGGHREP